MSRLLFFLLSCFAVLQVSRATPALQMRHVINPATKDSRPVSDSTIQLGDRVVFTCYFDPSNDVKVNFTFDGGKTHVVPVDKSFRSKYSASLAFDPVSIGNFTNGKAACIVKSDGETSTSYLKITTFAEGPSSLASSMAQSHFFTVFLVILILLTILGGTIGYFLYRRKQQRQTRSSRTIKGDEAVTHVRVPLVRINDGEVTSFRSREPTLVSISPAGAGQRADNQATRPGPPKPPRKPTLRIETPLETFRKEFPSFVVDAELIALSRKQIGKGNFGEVFEGYLNTNTPGDDFARLAVKVSEDTNLLEEARCLARISPHPNVLALVGVFVNPKDDIPQIYMATAFCEKGDLQTFLRNVKKRGNFKMETPDISPSGYMKPVQPKPVSQSASSSSSKSTQSTGTEVTTDHLIDFALQIARGMTHIHAQNPPCLHRDLATRNILLTENLQCKIADFGHAKKCNQGGYYIRQGLPVQLPLNSLAPEITDYEKYSTKSDVWAYGVTLYELFTLGEYAGRISFMDLEKGVRLPQPQYCPTDIYQDLMMRCWRFDRKERPTFAEIVALLERRKAMRESVDYDYPPDP